MALVSLIQGSDVSKIVHRGILHEEVPLGILRHVPHGIHLLDCFRGNAWDPGIRVWVEDHHALLCASS